MTRRCFGLLILLALLFVPAQAAQGATRPNILVIVTDDQRAEGTFGVMPSTTSWLRQGGTDFTDAWATTPLCCPSRATIFTGLYAHNHGVKFNGGNPFDERITVTHYLHQAGYRTGIVGKYLNNWPLDRDPAYFDDFKLAEGSYRDSLWNINGHMRRVKEYETKFVGQQASGFIGRQEQSDSKPWFLYVAPSAPHATLTPQRVYFEPERRYAHANVGPLPDNPARSETDLSDKPPFLRALVQKVNSLPPGVIPGPEATRAGQLRLLMSADDMVSQIHDELASTGELRNTIVIYLSDNGLIWGEHGGVPIKDLPYPAAAQIPLMVDWPGHVAAGATDPRLAGNIDVAPTILDAAGMWGAGSRLDGNSLLRSGWERDRLLLEYFGLGNAIPPWAGIVTPTVQYTEYQDRTETQDPSSVGIFREFYDLTADPWELENPFGDGNPLNDPTVANYAAQLHRDMTCKGSSCP